MEKPEQYPITIDSLLKIYENSNDFKSKEILFGADVLEKPHKGYIVFFDAMSNQDLISHHIIEPILEEFYRNPYKEIDTCFEQLSKVNLHYSSILATDCMEEVLLGIHRGDSALIFEGIEKAYVFDTKGYVARTINIGSEENTFRTAKDSFVEKIRTNTSILDKKLKAPISA